MRLFPAAPVAAALIAALPLPAGAVNLWQCDTPYRPTCADGYKPFDQQTYDSCWAEVDRYVAKVNAYMDCVAETAQAEEERVSNEANAVVDAFNCLAQGSGSC